MKNRQNMSRETHKKSEAMEIRPYSRLVSLPVHANNIFHFPEGIPAFEDMKEFVFICKPDTAPFMFMQAIAPADISFVCIDPFLVYPDYKPRISEADTSFLHLDKPEDVLVLGIVTVNADMHKTTVNLQGPIAINMQACLGKQIICESQNYPVRYRIWDALNSLSQKTADKAREKKLAHANS